MSMIFFSQVEISKSKSWYSMNEFVNEFVNVISLL